MDSEKQGILYLCATPIGNLGDITMRVVDTLRCVNLIAAEDTRNSIKLLNHFEINTPMTSYHEHNKYEKAETLIQKLLAGDDIALITDAGTPAISDPGEVLVRRCIEEGIRVTSLPGPVAAITALTISGMDTRRFVFEGFLPYDKKEKERVLTSLAGEHRTIILYEAPHHLIRTLKELEPVLGSGRRISLCKELTKKHENALHTTIGEALTYYEANEPRGEYVLIIEGKSIDDIEEEQRSRWDEITLEEHMEIYLQKGLDKKEAMKSVAADRGISKREVYQELIK